jgi:phosphatidylinositol alpha-mannosyltransferase|uniref:Glycosyltransferase family 1 protein n=1 Tax=candidate division WOR-3 bacterium TaxID=2052148 RepID=A0A7V3VUL6_UNCW3
MKVCLVSDPYYPYPSGVSEYTHYLAKYLRRFGHTVKILTTHYRGEDFEPDVVRVGRVFYIPMNKSFATLSIGLEIPIKVRDFLDSEHFDVVHTMGPFPPSISFFALHYSKALNITTFHSTGFKHYRFGSYVFRKIFKRYIQKLHGLIAVSETARDTFLPYIPGEYTIIPNGVDIERFHPEVPGFEEFRNKKKKILYLGRLDRRKGLIELLNALPFVLEEIPDIQLIVVGKGPLEKDCRRLVKDLNLMDVVLFRGYAIKEDIPRYYASCDVYCSPALGGESFGIVLLEAMATGKPVIASNIPGYDKVIKDGYNGLLFNPHNPRDIAQKIIMVLKDEALRRYLIENGKNFVNDYSWLNIARRIENFYFKKIAEEKLTRG